MNRVIHIIILCAAFLLPATNSSAQKAKEEKKAVYKMPSSGNYMRYLVENGDTVYIATIRAAIKYADGGYRLWSKEYRLLYNFGKAYPYALEAKRLMAEVDQTIEEDNLVKRKREKYINTIQADLLDRYEPVLRNMTISQGKLLIKLIGRETGFTPYEIIHDYKNGMAAGTWQGIAKLFGGDLKKHYDPEGEDHLVEYLVRKWQQGEYPDLFFSIYGKYPEIPVIDRDKPAKGRGMAGVRSMVKETKKANKAESKKSGKKT